MEVTEHNISEWELNLEEIRELIRLVKNQLKLYEGDRVTQNYYGEILGKLVLMKLENK